MADRYTYNGAVMAETPWRAGRELPPNEQVPVRPVDPEKYPATDQAATYFLGPSRPLREGETDHIEGGSCFGSFYYRHTVVSIDGVLWWVRTHNDAR